MVKELVIVRIRASCRAVSFDSVTENTSAMSARVDLSLFSEPLENRDARVAIRWHGLNVVLPYTHSIDGPLIVGFIH